MKEKNQWYIERFDFDNRILSWKVAGGEYISGDEELLKFINEIISRTAYTVRWKITKVIKEIVD